MIRKYIQIITFVMLLSVSIGFSQDCFFDTYNTSCQRIETSYNTFNLGVNAQNDLSEVVIEVYNTDNPSNKLYFDQDNFQISQIMPFLEAGVYSINVKAYDLAGNLKEKSFEYIFDNLEPLPPIVPRELKSVSNTIIVNGEANKDDRVTVDVRGATGGFQTFSATTTDEGTYSITLNLHSGINYARFYILKPNGLKSAYVERVILSGNIDENPSLNVQSVSIDNLVSLNDRTIGRFTSKRNFYVQGSTVGAASGTLIYVNGVKAVVDQNGKFGAFILLNQGTNTIVAKANNVESTSREFDYVDLQFRFEHANYNKIVTSPSETIEGLTNFDYPFLAFLNGQFIVEVHPSNGVFSVPFSNLRPGKNFFELRGIDGQKITDIIYYDTQNPVVQQITPSNLASNSQLGFELTDDIGININSVLLKINNQNLDIDTMTVKGDFFLFNLVDYQDGDYTYLLTGEDLSGKSFSLNGQLNINEHNTVITNVLAEGEMIGNHIYTRSGNIRMTMIPSRNIAFKSIYLDGIEQTDYEILSNNNIKLNVNIEEVSGTLNTKFINQDYSLFEQNFIYHSDREEPIVNLDYIANPYTIDKVKVTGEIIDSNFDWQTLKFNGQTSFTRYGNYFEAIIDVNSANLEISGSDFAGNTFRESYGYLLYKDVSPTIVELSSNATEIVDKIEGSMPTSDEHKVYIGVLNLVNSYDGFDMNEVYLASDGFALPVQDRPGYRSLNMKGYESSGLEFNSIRHIRVLPTTEVTFLENGRLPEVYLSGNDIITLDGDGFVQGNIVPSYLIESVVVNNGGNCEFDDISFVCDVHLSEGDNPIVVTITDSEGHVVSTNMIIVQPVDDLSITIEDILGEDLYRANGENYLFGDTVELDARVSQEAIIKILINGNEILDGRQNGSFSLDLDLSEVIDGIDSSELSFQLKAEDEQGHVAYSNVLKVLYQRVFETFARVWVR